MMALAPVCPRADGAPTEAGRAEGRRLFEDGRRRYDLHEFDTALAEFKRAYVVTDEPALLHDIALCLQQLGRNVEAADFFRTFLRRSPQLGPKDRAEIQEIIRELEGQRRELASSDAALANAAPRAHDTKPVYRRWWLWTAVGGGVVLAVGLGLGLGLGLRGDDFSTTRPGIVLK